MRVTKSSRTLALLTLAITAGCGTTTFRSPTAQAFRKAELGAGDQTASLGSGQRQPGQPFRVASLGAGDRLGRQIYVNDVVLASARQLNKPIATPQANPRMLQAGVTVTDLDQGQ